MGNIEIVNKKAIVSPCCVQANDIKKYYHVVCVYVYYQEYYKTGRKKGGIKTISYTLHFDTEQEVLNVCNKFESFDYKIEKSFITELMQEKSYIMAKEKQQIKYYFDFFMPNELR